MVCLFVHFLSQLPPSFGNMAFVEFPDTCINRSLDSRSALNAPPVIPQLPYDTIGKDDYLSGPSTTTINKLPPPPMYDSATSGVSQIPLPPATAGSGMLST